MRYVIFLVLLGTMLAPAALADPNLDAPLVKDKLRLEWNVKQFQWAADDKSGTPPLESNAVFLTRSAIAITWYRLNPLRQQVSATASALADPAAQVLGQLISALQTVGTTLVPTPVTTMPGLGLYALTSRAASSTVMECSAPGSAEHNITELSYLLYPHEGSGRGADNTIAQEFNNWADAINRAFQDGKAGDSAVNTAITSINSFTQSLSKDLDAATSFRNKIQECSQSKAKIPANDHGFYISGGLSIAGVDSRLAVLHGILSTLQDLANGLTVYADSARWDIKAPQEFKLLVVTPSATDMQNVAVSLNSITVTSDGTPDDSVVNQKTVGSTTFIVRKYARFVPEIGVGPVFTSLRAPQYGTGTNASGQTIVTRVEDTALNISPSVMVNFLCRCNWNPFVPMFQIGATASKDVPAILTGVGLHLFGAGKGDIAIAGGAVLGWYKDLQTLKVGDVIAGTKDITADLGYIGTPHVKAYFTIQYTFK